MSLFLSKALRRAEVFLEQVDESVAQASRRLVVEGATGAVKDNETELLSDEEKASFSRSSSIPTAEFRTRSGLPEVEDQLNIEIGTGVPPEYPVVDNGEDFSPPSNENSDHQEWVSQSVENDNQGDLKAADYGVDQTNNDSKFHGEQKDGFSDNRNASIISSEPIASEMTTHAPLDPSASSNAILSGLGTGQKPKSFSTAPVSAADDQFMTALKAENAELRSELDNVEVEFEKSRRERGKLVKNMKRMKEVISEMDETLRDKSVEVRQLQEQLLQSKEQLETLQTSSAMDELRSKEEFDTLRKELSNEILQLKTDLSNNLRDAEFLRKENERLKEALLQGNEVELAAADGARQEASQAHVAYEAEAKAHQETRRLAKEREEVLQEEAALATRALATAQRKAEESTMVASDCRSTARSLEAKLVTATKARDAAFARISDLEESLRLFERKYGEEAPGQREAKEMQQTVSELENALEAKNVELSRLECEVEALRTSARTRRDSASPRASSSTGAEAASSHELEMRLRHMADAALRKQGQLEGLRSENRALQHQLTAERKRTREAQAMAAAASSSRQSIRGGFRSTLESGESDLGDRMFGVRDGPLARFRVPRNFPKPLAKVIAALDRISAQALAFLRKEPLLRLVVLTYAIAIHIFMYSLLHWHVKTVTIDDQLRHVAGGKKPVG